MIDNARPRYFDLFLMLRNEAKFEDWILDVFKKKRDLDGKKVK